MAEARESSIRYDEQGRALAAEGLAEEEDCAVEDWSSSVRCICAECSEGPAPPVARSTG